MKIALLSALLLGGLLACKSSGSDPTPTPTPPADPLLGHWQADTKRSVWYNLDGSTAKDNIITDVVYTLDVTPTTWTVVATYSNGAKTSNATTYTRSGETLTIVGITSVSNQTSAKSLTSASFTYQEDITQPRGTKAIETWSYHR
jgi:hypothetical protein